LVFARACMGLCTPVIGSPHQNIELAFIMSALWCHLIY
jgi:hypothetical protein